MFRSWKFNDFFPAISPYKGQTSPATDFLHQDTPDLRGQTALTIFIMTTPTLINLPPPPSDPVTPSDMGPWPSGSALPSWPPCAPVLVRIDLLHHDTGSRARRSDLAPGRLGACGNRARGWTIPSNAAVSATHFPGYFDSHAGLKERSTVGSASATGSVGGRTTWASGSDAFDADKMSEGPDADDTVSNMSNISDEGNASLVGFGEGANSTISGPTSRPSGLNRMSSGGLNARPTSMGSSNVSRPNPLASYLQQQQHHAGDTSMMSPSPAGSSTPEPTTDDARMFDGMTFDSDVVDTTARTPRLVTPSLQESGGFDTPGRD
ncbi:hypothetical protein N7512_007340 [Penicillium capsulatum]|nr:hypothetical protein N7512_007340 [Penicillium capsulatum]